MKRLCVFLLACAVAAPGLALPAGPVAAAPVRVAAAAPVRAVPAASLWPAPAAPMRTTCAATGTYVMRPRGPLPMAAGRAGAVVAVFPGAWGSGMVRISAYSGCGQPTYGGFSVVRMYGPPVERARPSAQPAMPIYMAGLQAISGTIRQDTTRPADAASVTVSGTLTVGASACRLCPVPTNDTLLRRLLFGPVHGRLVWSARAPQQITLSFDLVVQLNKQSTRYSVRISGTKR